MANDFRGLFSNNRRRESSAVVGTVPFVVEPADIREGTAEVTLTSGAYKLLSIPANVLITGVNLIVTDVFDGAGSKLAAKIGAVEVIAATDITTAGVTGGTAASFPLLTTTSQDLAATMTIAGSGTKGVAKLVVSYIDYDRATMSYIGEE